MSPNRGRLVFAGAAAALLAAVVIAVALTGSSGDDGSDDPCLTAWNDDALARSDGVHAYAAHGYRATLIARVDPQGEALPDAPAEAPSPQARCLVVFASPRVDEEPDFGVRVMDGGRWTGLADADRIQLGAIAELQGNATQTANATLLPDGRLAD